MEDKKRWPSYIGYGVIILLAYLIQFAPLMVKIFGAYPMPLLMVTVILAMFEREIAAGVIGLVCGMLSDINMINGSGFHAIIYMFAAVIISLLIETLLQNNILSLVFISAVTFIVNSGVELVTKAHLTSGALSLYLNTYLRSAVLSFIFIIPCYLIFALIFGHSLRYKKPVGVVDSKLKKYRTNIKKRHTVSKKGY